MLQNRTVRTLGVAALAAGLLAVGRAEAQPEMPAITDAALRIDLAAFTGSVLVGGNQVNMVTMFDVSPNNLGSVDLTSLLFGGGGALDLGTQGTAVFDLTIPAPFRPALDYGRVGLWITLTDTSDAAFAIDFISVAIARGASVNEFFYGSQNDGFGRGLPDFGLLPQAVQTFLPPNSTGRGFDETVASKSIHVIIDVPAPGAIAVAAAAFAATAPRRRR